MVSVVVYIFVWGHFYILKDVTWFVLDSQKKTQLLSSEHDVGHVKLQVRATLTERPLVARNEVTSGAGGVPHDESLEDRELQEVLNSVFDDDHDGPLATSHPRQPGMASFYSFFYIYCKAFLLKCHAFA